VKYHNFKFNNNNNNNNNNNEPQLTGRTNREKTHFLKIILA